MARSKIHRATPRVYVTKGLGRKLLARKSAYTPLNGSSEHDPSSQSGAHFVKCLAWSVIRQAHEAIQIKSEHRFAIEEILQNHRSDYFAKATFLPLSDFLTDQKKHALVCTRALRSVLRPHHLHHPAKNAARVYTCSSERSSAQPSDSYATRQGLVCMRALRSILRSVSFRTVLSEKRTRHRHDTDRRNFHPPRSCARSTAAISIRRDLSPNQNPRSCEKLTTAISIRRDPPPNRISQFECASNRRVLKPLRYSAEDRSFHQRIHLRQELNRVELLRHSVPLRLRALPLSYHDRNHRPRQPYM